MVNEFNCKDNNYNKNDYPEIHLYYNQGHYDIAYEEKMAIEIYKD